MNGRRKSGEARMKGLNHIIPKFWNGVQHIKKYVLDANRTTNKNAPKCLDLGLTLNNNLIVPNILVFCSANICPTRINQIQQMAQKANT